MRNMTFSKFDAHTSKHNLGKIIWDIDKGALPKCLLETLKLNIDFASDRTIKESLKKHFLHLLIRGESKIDEQYH